MGDIYLTKEGYQKLVEELEYLQTVKRRQLSKAIGEARAHGDISENAEYDAAKDAQGLNEKKIAELQASGHLNARTMSQAVNSVQDADHFSADERNILATILKQNIVLQKPELVNKQADS